MFDSICLDGGLRLVHSWLDLGRRPCVSRFAIECSVPPEALIAHCIVDDPFDGDKNSKSRHSVQVNLTGCLLFNNVGVKAEVETRLKKVKANSECHMRRQRAAAYRN